MDKIMIETGIDRLVRLLQNAPSITVSNAALKLGVGKGLVIEWAELLEDSGIVSVSHKLTGVTISLADNSDFDKEQVGVMKDLFARKAEIGLCTLNKQEELIAKSMQEFQTHKIKLDSEMQLFRKEIEEIKSFQETEDKMLLGAESKKTELSLKLKQLDEQIILQNKDRLKLIAEIEKDSVRISEESKKISEIEMSIKSLNEKLSQSKGIITSIEKSAFEKSNILSRVKLQLDSFDKQSEELNRLALEEHKSTKALLESEKSYITKALKSQSNVLDKIIASKKKFDFSRNLHKKVDKIVQKNAEFANKLKHIDTEREEIRTNYLSFMKKIHSINVDKKDPQLAYSITQLEREFNNSLERRNKLESQFKKLATFFEN